MTRILDSLATNLVDTIHMYYNKQENKTKIDEVTDSLLKTFMDKIKPYFLLVTTLLIILIVLHIVQFYYYIRVVLRKVPESDKVQAIRDIMDIGHRN